MYATHALTHKLTLSNVQSTQTMASVIYLMHTSLRILNMIGNLLTFILGIVYLWHSFWSMQRIPEDSKPPITYRRTDKLSPAMLTRFSHGFLFHVHALDNVLPAYFIDA